MQAGQDITLDFMIKSNIKKIAKQNDINSRYLNISLNRNRKAVTISDTATATLNITRSDGQKKSYIGTIENNIVNVFLSAWAVELEGILLCDVSIIENNERLTTMPFKIDIVKACCTTDDIEDADSEDVITSLVSTVTEHSNSINRNTSDISSISSELAVIETIIHGLDKPIMSQTVTINCEDWQYNGSTNKYECTIIKDTVTSTTYIIANELSNVLYDADIQSNDGSYTLTALEVPSRAVNLLLIFLNTTKESD